MRLFWQGCKVSQIVENLVLEHEILVSKQGVRLFMKRYRDRKTISRKPGSPKLSSAIQRLIEDVMRQDDETAATQLQAILAERGICFFGDNSKKQMSTTGD